MVAPTRELVMKRNSFLVFIFAIVVSSVTLAAPRPKADKDDLAKFDGAWVFSSWLQYGRSLDDESRESAKWSVKGDKYTFEIDGAREEGTIKLDPTKKIGTIDLAITEGNDRGKEQFGIYKIDGETITFCFARAGVKERPTDFTSTADNNNILVTIKRSKKEN